jgi:hypothetical protein
VSRVVRTIVRVFFYTAYMVLLRIYVRRKSGKGALPEEFY